MLTAAAAIHDSTSVPLLVIGGGWLLAGLAGVWQLRRLVREIVLHGETVEFRFPARDIVIPAQEITEIRWPLWDPGNRRYLRFRTHSNGVIRTPSRLEGLREFMIETPPVRRIPPAELSQRRVTGIRPGKARLADYYSSRSVNQLNSQQAPAPDHRHLRGDRHYRRLHRSACVRTGRHRCRHGRHGRRPDRRYRCQPDRQGRRS